MVAWRYEISLLALKKYFTSERSERVKYFSILEEKFVFPRGHVISSMYKVYFVITFFSYFLCLWHCLEVWILITTPIQSYQM